MSISTSTRRILMAIAIILLWFSSYVYVPILSTYSESVGASLGLVGIILGSYGFVQMVMRIPIGIASDRLQNRSFFLIFAFASAALSALGFYFFTNAELFVLFRLLSGLAVSNWAIFITSYQTLDLKSDNSTAIGTVTVFQALGNLLGMFTGGIIADAFGPRTTFLVSLVTSLIGIAILAVILMGNASIRTEAKSTDRKQLTLAEFIGVFQDKRLLFYSIMTSLMHMIQASTLVGFNPTVMDNVGANEFLIGLGTTLGAIPSVFGGPLAIGPMRRRFGTDTTAMIGFFLLTLPTFFFVFIPNIYVLLLLQLIAGLGKGILAPLLMSASTSHMPDETRSTALSAHQAIYSVGMSLGPAITGVISGRISMAAAFVVLGVVGIASMGMIFVFNKRKPKRATTLYD